MKPVELKRRRALALSLIGIGAATTVPAALAVFGPKPVGTLPTESLPSSTARSAAATASPCRGTIW